MFCGDREFLNSFEFVFVVGEMTDVNFFCFRLFWLSKSLFKTCFFFENWFYFFS